MRFSNRCATFFMKLKDATHRFVLAFLISEIQGDFENVALVGSLRILVILQLIEKMKTEPHRVFYVETSDICK